MSNEEALKKARALLSTIPPREFYEVPGKADVLYELRDYSQDPEQGAEKARLELPFLFKPFEVGQKPPPSKGQESTFGREPTIHEYLDWTVTAASSLETLDFSGFRVLTLLPRYRPMWPPPCGEERPDSTERAPGSLGAPKDAVPLLMPYGRPISATTIRCGPDYVEVPFFATKQSARGKGYGKALLYAIEDICRFLGMSKILLCSTDDAVTVSTWQHLGFRHTLAHELAEWGIVATELVHMTNTVQMVKMVGEPPEWKSFRIRHEGFDQRLYYIPASTKTQTMNRKRKDKQTDANTDTVHKAGRVDMDEKKESLSVKDPPNGMSRSLLTQKDALNVDKTGTETNGAPHSTDTSETDRNNIIEQSLQTKKIIDTSAADLCAELG